MNAFAYSTVFIALRLLGGMPMFHKAFGVPNLHQLQIEVRIEMELKLGCFVRFCSSCFSLFLCLVEKRFRKLLVLANSSTKLNMPRWGN